MYVTGHGHKKIPQHGAGFVIIQRWSEIGRKINPVDEFSKICCTHLEINVMDYGTFLFFVLPWVSFLACFTIQFKLSFHILVCPTIRLSVEVIFHLVIWTCTQSLSIATHDTVLSWACQFVPFDRLTSYSRKTYFIWPNVRFRRKFLFQLNSRVWNILSLFLCTAERNGMKAVKASAHISRWAPLHCLLHFTIVKQRTEMRKERPDG